jgi:hypothetical protein
VEGFLVPVGDLINGISIVLETAEGHDTLDFFHIEVEGHDALDAEGAPVKRCGNRRSSPACRSSASAVDAVNFAHGCVAWRR